MVYQITFNPDVYFYFNGEVVANPYHWSQYREANPLEDYKLTNEELLQVFGSIEYLKWLEYVGAGFALEAEDWTTEEMYSKITKKLRLSVLTFDDGTFSKEWVMDE